MSLVLNATGVLLARMYIVKLIFFWSNTYMESPEAWIQLRRISSSSTCSSQHSRWSKFASVSESEEPARKQEVQQSAVTTSYLTHKHIILHTYMQEVAYSIAPRDILQTGPPRER